MAYLKLPVSDLPQVDFPTIQVNANLPGASPETMNVHLKGAFLMGGGAFPNLGMAGMYPLDATIEEKIEAIAKRVYGADGIFLLKTARDKIARFDADGLSGLPICMRETLRRGA